MSTKNKNNLGKGLKKQYLHFFSGPTTLLNSSTCKQLKMASEIVVVQRQRKWAVNFFFIRTVNIFRNYLAGWHNILTSKETLNMCLNFGDTHNFAKLFHQLDFAAGYRSIFPSLNFWILFHFLNIFSCKQKGSENLDSKFF